MPRRFPIDALPLPGFGTRRVPFQVGYCFGVNTDDRTLVLLGGGQYEFEIATSIDRTTLSGNRVAVVGSGPATWLVVGVYAT